MINSDHSFMRYLLAAIALLAILSYFGWAQAQTLPDAKAKFASAMQEFKALAKNPGVLAPPAVDPHCWNPTKLGQMQIKKYTNEFTQPEGDLIGKMILADQEMQKFGDDNNHKAVNEAVCIMADRLVQKTKKALTAYGSDKRYIYPLLMAETQVAKVSKGLCGDDNSMEDLMGKCLGKVRDELLKNLKEQHDYTLIPTYTRLAGLAQALGANDEHDMLAQLSDALSFEITIEHQLDYYIDGKLMGTYQANGTAKVKSEEGLEIRGKGKMNLTVCQKREDCQPGEGKLPIPCTSTCDLQSYPTGNAVLRIDACDKNELTLLWVGFGGPKLEQWTRCWDLSGQCGNTRMSKQENIEKTAMSEKTNNILIEAGYEPPVSESFKEEGYFTKFHMPLQNNNVEAGRIEIVKVSKDKEYVLKLVFTVKHTPA